MNYRHTLENSQFINKGEAILMFNNVYRFNSPLLCIGVGTYHKHVTLDLNLDSDTACLNILQTWNFRLELGIRYRMSEHITNMEL